MKLMLIIYLMFITKYKYAELIKMSFDQLKLVKILYKSKIKKELHNNFFWIGNTQGDDVMYDSILKYKEITDKDVWY
jgi:hypothetical protein